MYGYIYLTTCIVNNKIYVGQKKSSRFLGNRYLGSGKILKKAIEKYGYNNFTVEMLCECDSRDELNKKEIEFIDSFNSTDKSIGYNVSIGGTGGFLGDNVNGIKDRICITNGQEIRYIHKDSAVPDNWSIGNCKTAKKHNMSNYYLNNEARINNSLSKSGKNNSMYGKGYLISGGKNGKAIKFYIFNDIRFECRKELVKYLNSIGYDVSVSTIRTIENNECGICIKRKYGYIISGLTWGFKDEDKVNKKSNT